MRSPSIGASMIGEDSGYRKKTMKLINLLLSEEFQKGELTCSYLWKKMGFKQETVKYHYYKLYLPEKFKIRYLKK